MLSSKSLSVAVAGLVKRSVRFGPLAVLCPIVLFCWTLGDARSPAQFPIDLIPTYLAGKLWLAGQVDAVYHDGPWLPASGPNAAWAAMTQTLKISAADTAYAYSPTYLLLFLPLIALLSAQGFFWTFATLSALAALLLGRECARLARVEGPWIPWLTALLCALSFPCTYAAMLGQNVVLAALFVVFAFRAVEQDRPVLGGALLLLGCIFKPWCLILIAVPVLGRRWRASLVALLGYLALVVVLPRLLFPAALVAGYERVLGVLPKVSVLAFNNISLRALIHRGLMDDWTPKAWNWSQYERVTGSELLAELAIVGAVLGFYALALRLRRPNFQVLYSEAMGLVLVTLGVCWSHYLVFALPVVVRSLLSTSTPKSLRLLAFCLCVWGSHMMSAAAPSLPVMRPPLLWALIYSSPLLLTVGLSLALAWSRSLPRSAPTPSASLVAL